MNSNESRLTVDTLELIHQEAIAIAKKTMEDSIPDPLFPGDLAYQKNLILVEQQIKSAMEKLLGGLEIISKILPDLAKENPELWTDEIQQELMSLALGNRPIEQADEGKLPKVIFGLSEKTLTAFNSAAAYLHENKEYEQSLLAYQLLAFFDPIQPANWLGYGHSALSTNRFEEAIAAYHKVANITPDDYQCHLFASYCYDALGRQEEAIKSVDDALEILNKQPNNKELTEQALQLKTAYQESTRKAA